MIRYLKVGTILSYTEAPDGFSYLTAVYNQCQPEIAYKFYAIDFRTKKQNKFIKLGNNSLSYYTSRLYNLRISEDGKYVEQGLPDFNDSEFKYKIEEEFIDKYSFFDRVRVLKYMQELIGWQISN